MTIHRTFIRNTYALCGLMSFALGCSSGEVDLGDGIVTQDFRQPSRCADSAVLEGDVTVTNQEELESLAGCEEITGNLRIQIFADADLSPLASLRVVRHVLALGDSPETRTQEEADAIQPLLDAGYLTSLHGLEALERVDALSLSSVLVTDFTELESLTVLRQLVGFHLVNLESLSGLERVELDDLSLSDLPVLDSLDGVLMIDTIDSILLTLAPNLTNIDAVTGVAYVNSVLMLSDTGLETLPEWPIQGVSQIVIQGNPDLVSIDGIAGISGLVDMTLAGNPSLRTFPDFTNLLSLNSLSLSYNGFETLDLNFPAFSTTTIYNAERELVVSSPLVEIANNPQLTSIANSAGFEAVQNFVIQGNEQLTNVDLGTLATADRLIIDGNPALSSVSTPALATVDHLVLTNNPQLDVSAFDAVQVFSREVTLGATP